jgi:hypothetical protein
MTVRLSDVIVPSVFTPYVQNLTKEKSALIAAGALVNDASIDALLSGPGLTFNMPNFKDLANDDENISNDDPTVKSSPKKIGTFQQIAVRMNRNQSWSSMDLVQQLIGPDPLNAIASRVAAYWTRRLQMAFIAMFAGVFADNAAAPTGTEHVINDLTLDVSGGAFSDNVTNFTATNFLNASLKMGDALEDLSILMVHSVVYNRMQKLNLIDFVTDSNQQVRIPTYMGLRVVLDDAMPNPAGVAGINQTGAGIYHSWIFGPSVAAFGSAAPPVATETKRDPDSGNGSGQDTLFSRVQWTLHPYGHAYTGTSPQGGPSNAATANNLAHAASWTRVAPERKQIPVVRLITREA